MTGLRQETIKQVYDAQRQLVQSASEALGPSADSHQLTAKEEEFAWQYPDNQALAQRDQVWAEELASAQQKYPDLAYDALIEEARPHVGARLFPLRARVVGSGGRIDVRDQCDYAERLRDRVQRSRGDVSETEETNVSGSY